MSLAPPGKPHAGTVACKVTQILLRATLTNLIPGGTRGKKNPPANAGDMGSIPVSGRSPRETNGNPLQYSYLENPMDRGDWWATVHGVAKSQTGLRN